MEHLCTVCGLPVEQHSGECECGERHFPPLCCPGCGCGSFEMAHPKRSNNEELYDAAVAATRAVIFDESIDDEFAQDVFDGLMDDIEDMRRERFAEKD